MIFNVVTHMKNFLVALLLLLASHSFAQTKDPVRWSAEYKPLSGKEGEILITATIEKGWHTYSQRETDAGPIPTSFSFTPGTHYSLSGKTEETGAKEEYVSAFEAKIFVFHDKAEFRQKISLKGAAAFKVPLKIEYMSCNDMMCLPPRTATLEVEVRR